MGSVVAIIPFDIPESEGFVQVKTIGRGSDFSGNFMWGSGIEEISAGRKGGSCIGNEMDKRAGGGADGLDFGNHFLSDIAAFMEIDCAVEWVGLVRDIFWSQITVPEWDTGIDARKFDIFFGEEKVVLGLGEKLVESGGIIWGGKNIDSVGGTKSVIFAQKKRDGRRG